MNAAGPHRISLVPVHTATAPPTLVLSLAPEPEAAGHVRRELVRAGVDPDLEHTVSLLATEVVTNSIQHSGTGREIRVAVVLESNFARVEVLDAGEGFDPEVRHEGGGFGLRLVDKLATRWGVERARGTLVWFEVDRRRRRFAR
jgi:two-component sensor histidine kinase